MAVDVCNISEMADNKRRPGSARDFYLRPINGPSCPKCGAIDVRRHFGWAAFGIAIVALFLWAAVSYWTTTIVTGFAADNLRGAISTFLVIAVAWIFFSAIIRKNHCNACGHRWRG